MRNPKFSIRRLRVLLLLALAIGMVAFTGTMLKHLDNLSERFGPQVRADLEWCALRGAAELARATDLGVAKGDRSLVLQAFAPYAASPDVVALVAVDAEGKVIAMRGEFALADALFTAKPNVVSEGPGYLTSWAPVTMEGGEVGRVAVAVSTARLTETQSSLETVSDITLLACALIVVYGIVVIVFLARVVATRDKQLEEHAANLEKRVEERTRELDERNREMRGVLDNVAQGFVTIDTFGQMATERSAIVGTWFGEVASGRLSDLVRAGAPDFASWLDVSLEQIRDDFMPLEVTLAQMPRSFVHDKRSFEVSYSPIMTGDKLQRLFVIISDVTAQLASERAEREQRELITVFQRVGSDRAACEEFLEEAGTLVEQLHMPLDRVVHDRALHTLKGNAGMFGFEGFASLCHTIESELHDAGDADLTEEQAARVTSAWELVATTLRRLLGNDNRDVVQIDRIALEAAIADARAGHSGYQLGLTLAKWCDEPVRLRFERFARQARALAKRLGKETLEVEIDDNDVHLDAGTWGALWSVLVHIVRNAVDHGIPATPPPGKTPTLSFMARRTERDISIAIADNGSGVPWEAIRDKAKAAGLPYTTQEDLIEAMFADGFSTRETATHTSGRGVGLAAVRCVVDALGGRINVISSPNAGTRFELRFAATRYTLSRVPRAS